MKTKEIASRYGIDKAEFEKFVKQSSVKYKSGLSGMVIDENVDTVVALYKRRETDLASERERKAKEEASERDRKAKAAAEKKEALAKMLITSGFNFDGYTITKYSGYISGDDVVQIDRGSAGFFSSATDVGSSLMSSLVEIRRNAMAELKEAAYALGCNAVIGVDFDYLTLDPETANSSGGTTYMPYVFGVTANGNAVIIGKNKTAGEL
jgi:uncharacterized protein YbjQ (UPF0145 family)